MPTSVSSAFEQFRTQQVDLAASDVEKARNSRDFLQAQILSLPGRIATFPRLAGTFLAFGSFARRTKVRPLDDIDLLVPLVTSGLSVIPAGNYTFTVQVDSSNQQLWALADVSGYLSSRRLLNSTKVLNQFRSGLEQVSNYRQSALKRTGAAVVLNLLSYPWAFDIVPAIPVANYQGQTDYYLIPNGRGQWMATDPRRDQRLITELNQRHNEWFLRLTRVIKYWNIYRHSPPTLASYFFETLLINGFRYSTPLSGVRSGLPDAFRQIAAQVINICPDPKGLGPALNAGQDWSGCQKVQQEAYTMARLADSALEHERRGEHRQAINVWRSIFPNFPTYG
jgi:hypothetical protein